MTDTTPWSAEDEANALPDLEHAALRAFMAAGTSDSPGIVSVLRRALRYAAIDGTAQQIVIDARAFMLGLAAAGRLDTPSDRYGNTATWMAAWIAERHVRLDAIIATGLTGTDALVDAARQQYTVVPSASMLGAIKRAVTFAGHTGNKQAADLRHLFAAIALTDTNMIDLMAHLGWRASAADTRALRQELYERISLNPEPGEDLAIWRDLLRVDQPAPRNTRKRVQGKALPPEPPEAEQVSGFAADRPGQGPADDPLKIGADVTAFARLICLEQMEPPLSIGLFGGWGSGKSTFMHLLEAEVEKLVAGSRKRRASKAASAPPKDEPTFIRNVVQIRFNAWHFADANLWASLTAEFFDQLRAGGHSKSGKAIHARLVERVNGHVHLLANEAKATRDALAKSEETVRDAQKARDEAAEQATEAAGKAVSQVLVDSVVSAYEQHKVDLVELGGKKTTKDIRDFVALAKDVQSIGGQLDTLRKYVFARGWRSTLAAIGVAAIAVATYLLVNTDALSGQTLLSIVGFIGGLAAFSRSVLPGIKLIASVARSTATFSRDLDKELETQLKNVAEKEEALKQATAETEARRASAARAAKALARYVDPTATTGNPPRLLRFMLEDDPDTRALEKEIGLISRVRRLFQAVNEIVEEERNKPEAEREADVPDRIVIYIDDLDRCTPSQVYAVLQAIHLLLAFELFVVVVGVDIDWVQEAVAQQLRPNDKSDETESARRLATHYMEKIFQLPFWLQRLAFDGKSGGSYGDYVRGMLHRNLETETDLDLRTPVVPNVKVANRVTANDALASLDFTTGEATVEALADDSGLGEALATVKLTKAEVDFLASSAIGQLAGREPRTVKRFINIYRIIRARLDRDERRRFLGGTGISAAYPLVALLIALETGQTREVAKSLYDAETNPGPLLPFVKHPALKQALEAAAQARDGKPITGAECALWSARVRRYSFHRYD